ncbi:MAG TPA: CHRD domain-containing protein [Chloroflexia bacterium]|nr:CHRD domain-containing protein [Chloroflexia bacterium]
MRKFASLAMALLALLAFSGGSARAYQQINSITLMEQNNSGQSGTATFTLSDDEQTLTVEINISGGSSVPQPAHIHIGTCDNLDPKPFYPLTSVVNGKSVTVITEEDIANLDYEVSNQFAINVHKSAAEASVYVACGNIVPGGDAPVGMPRTGNSDNFAPMLASVALGLVAMGTFLSLRRRKA